MADSTSLGGPQIPSFYAGRAIFITGGTGFLGKVLIERILSTCPDVGPLFVLVREKRDRNSGLRLTEMKQSKVFDLVRERCPQQLDKLRLVNGDVTLPRLGMDDQSVKDIQDVSVVFHVAATLKFEEPLARAVSFNVRPVMELLKICDSLPHMKVLVHVSTAYSYSDLQHIREQVYPPPAPLHALLALTDTLDEKLLAKITPEYISPKPNTYTFTKAMAEHVVATHSRGGKYAAVICRPSIVISTNAAPFPGWVDNFAGPSGVVAAAGAGLLHVGRCATGARADMLPADIAAHAFLAAAWKAAIHNPSEVVVYNVTVGDSGTSWGRFGESLRRSLHVEPFCNSLWYPSGFWVANIHAFKISEFFLQTVPIHIAEYGAKLMGIKMPFSLISAERRIHAMTDVLSFFSLREWTFDTNNLRALHNAMTPEDRQLYNIDTESIEWEEQYRNFVIGTRRFLLGEDNDAASRRDARRRYTLLKVLHYGLLLVLFLLILRVFVNPVWDLVSSGLSLARSVLA